MPDLQTPGSKLDWKPGGKDHVIADQYGATFKVEPAWKSVDGFLHLHILDGQASTPGGDWVYQADLALTGEQVKELIEQLSMALKVKTGDEFVLKTKPGTGLGGGR